MGRRALQKIDPALDLSKHLLSGDDVSSPWDPQAIFPSSGPLEIEVGTGKGLFLCGTAADHPARNYLGIEVAKKYARFAAAQLANRQLQNALILCADAARVFCDLLADESLAAVHVYFPDPWWKQRHHKRRIMRPAFVRDVQRTLQPGGTLHFWTDVAAYFDETLALIAEETDLAGPYDVAISTTEPSEFRTHYERRMRLNGTSVHRAEYRKSGNSTAP